MQTFGDAIKDSSTRTWSTLGKARLVKVMGARAEEQMHAHARKARATSGAATLKLAAMGYITQEKYLYGLTASMIERVLGLRPFELQGIAYVYPLARLPRADEFEFKFSASMPDGEVFGSAHQSQADKARDDYRKGKNLRERSFNDVVQYYPPGSGMVPQWKLVKPVPVGPMVGVATSHVAFMRENGSIQAHKPHNRKQIG